MSYETLGALPRLSIRTKTIPIPSQPRVPITSTPIAKSLYPIIKPLRGIRLSPKPAAPSSVPQLAATAPVPAPPLVAPAVAMQASLATAEARYGVPVTDLDWQDNEPIEAKAAVTKTGSGPGGARIALIGIAALFLVPMLFRKLRRR